MNLEHGKIVFTDDELREIFALFTSATKEERKQIYADEKGHNFKNVNLSDEYALFEEKREYALDALRAVLYFLYTQGYALMKEKRQYDLSGIEDYFL